MAVQSSSPSAKSHPYVRAVVDYGGLAAFFLGYFFRLRIVAASAGHGWALATGGHGPRDLTAATWWLVGGSIVSLLVGLIFERRIAPMPLIAGGFALVFGGLTLFFHDPVFIQIKPTVTNLIFALGLFGGQLIGRNPLKWMLGEALPLPDEAWRTLTIRYGLFFLAMAALNEIVRRNFSHDVWVTFHGPGLWVLILVFSLTQTPLMMKYMHSNEPPPPPTE